MTTDFYVDESKAGEYLLVAVRGVPAQLKIARKELDTLVLPRQRSLHIKDESDSRRKLITDTIVRLAPLGMKAVVYAAGRAGTERQRRARCLASLVSDAASCRAAHIVLDLDETLVAWDRQQLIEGARAIGVADRISYGHARRHEECLLSIPDAIAWCWAKDRRWRQRVKPIVEEFRVV